MGDCCEAISVVDGVAVATRSSLASKLHVGSAEGDEMLWRCAKDGSRPGDLGIRSTTSEGSMDVLG